MTRHAAGWPRVLALGVCALALVGCAGGSTGTAEPVKTSQVDLPPSYLFQPAAIEVAAGTTVTWTNNDNFTHSVQVQGQSDVHMMTPGQSAEITFSTPGTYSYLCTLHAQNMKGTVLVS